METSLALFIKALGLPWKQDPARCATCFMKKFIEFLCLKPFAEGLFAIRQSFNFGTTPWFRQQIRHVRGPTADTFSCLTFEYSHIKTGKVRSRAKLCIAARHKWVGKFQLSAAFRRSTPLFLEFTKACSTYSEFFYSFLGFGGKGSYMFLFLTILHRPGWKYPEFQLSTWRLQTAKIARYCSIA